MKTIKVSEPKPYLSPRSSPPRALPFGPVFSLFAWAAILVGAFVVVTHWRQEAAHSIPPWRRGYRQRGELVRMQPGMRLSLGGNTMSGSFTWWFPPGDGRLQEPRYIANLSTQVGDYLVSVRQISEPRGTRLLIGSPPYPPTGPPWLQAYLNLQVLGTRPDALERLRGFATHLTAIDNTGHRLDLVETPQVFPLTHGRGGLVHLGSLAQDARYLKSLDGDLLVARAEQADAAGTPPMALRFHLDNVPIPETHHIYGVVAARYLDASHARQAAFLAHGKESVALTGKQADAWKSLFPPEVMDTGPLSLPVHLLLQPGIENRFPVSVPALIGKGTRDTIECALTPQIGADGELALRLAVTPDAASTPTVQLPIRTWDNAPVVMLLPSGSASPSRHSHRPLALWLNLYLERPAPNELLLPAFPFPAGREQQGGELVGQVIVAGEPLQLGSVRLTITRADARGLPIGEPTRLHVGLDNEGRWRFANIAPGSYVVQYQTLYPFFSNAVPATSPLPDYLRRRYGITDTAWEQPAPANAVVRAGGRTVLPAWEIR